MTTTDVFQGMNLEKPTSKVLAPPGGKSNICFGGYEEPAQRAPTQQQAQSSPIGHQQQQDYSPAKPIIPQSSSAGFNLLTGEPEAQSHSNQQRGGAQARQDPANMAPAGGRIGEKQVTRKNPPGGFSSFSFGNE